MIGDNSDTDGNGLKEKSIKSVLYVPENYNNLPVTLISKKSFRSANIIKRVSIPSSIKRVNHVAFAPCNGLENVEVDAKVIGENDDHPVFLSYMLEKVKISDNVETMRNFVFSGNNNLVDLKIYSAKVNLITTQFSECIKLEEVNLESEHDLYKTIDGVVYSKDGKILYLYPAGKKGDFIIPNGVTTLGRYAFRRNSTLTSLTIPDSVT